MAYCVSCGAYLPDGQSRCLACGYDEEAKKRAEKKTGGSAAAAQSSDEDLREILERHRKLQQEKNRQWAEQERERRQQQEENRKWAEREFARRQAEREAQAEQYVNRPSAARTGSGSTQTLSSGNKALAAMSYLSVLFALPYLFAPQDEYAMFHAKQGLRLFIFSIIADALSWIPFIGWLLPIARIVLMVKGIMNAVNGKKEPLPWIGTLGENK